MLDQPTTLKIDTVLGRQQERHDKGPLLLSAVQGIEGISMPFSYDLTLYGSLDHSDVDPRDMINTRATIGLRGESSWWWEQYGQYVYRCGVFQTFEKDETNEQNWEEGSQTDFRIFKARLVPAFRMMDLETRYRVFEDMTVLDIMEEVMDNFPNIGNIASYTSMHLEKQYPKIPYCVQFGESSFNFLSRLMGQFGIWYTFVHPDTDVNPASTKETMILGDSFKGLSECRLSGMYVVYKPPDLREISGFQRSFVPAHKRVWLSNFNLLHPTQVPRGDVGPSATYDMLKKGDDLAAYEREFFPATFDDPNNTDDTMKEQANDRMEDEEVDVLVVQGQSKNPSFLSGQFFHVMRDDTKTSSNNVGRPENNNYLIRQLSLAAFEYAYGHYTEQDVLNFFDSPLRWLWSQFRKKNLKPGPLADPTAALASAGLSNWVQGQQITQTGPPPPPGMNFFDTFTAGMTATAIGSLVQLAIGNNVKEIEERHADSYSNAFFAIPWDAPSYKLVPSPDGVKPRVYGPHLALVIGPDGSATKQQDLYCDAIGRVRVRFPWQLDVPPRKGQGGVNTDPLKSDRRTCWVPVSEGWAGRHYGTQFLPRIGQEVLVSFIDGDPDRPVITGRVYNAENAGEVTNLPFPDDSVKDTQLGKLTDLPNTVRSDPPLSGIKTWSIPTTGGTGSPLPTRFQLLRFSDKRGSEQYLVRAQHRLDITAFDKRYESIGSDRHLTVGGEMASPPANAGDYIARVFRHYHLHVGDPAYATQSGNRITLLEQNEEIRIKKDSNQVIGGNWSTSTGGQVTIDANGIDGTIVLNATTNISLTVGESSIVITPAAIVVTSPMVLINSEGPPPAEPIPPEVDAPQEPNAADTGGTLTPPE